MARPLAATNRPQQAIRHQSRPVHGNLIDECASKTNRVAYSLQIHTVRSGLEWHRERVALLTNLTARELPDTPVTATRLPDLPLLAPTAGLLAQFLSRWYGLDYRGVLHVIADIDSLNYGLNLLTTHLLHGCLLTTERVADAVLEGRLPGLGLRKIDLADDYQPRLEIVTGIFARKGERDRYAPHHPLNLLWNAFAEATPTRPVPAVLPG